MYLLAGEAQVSVISTVSLRLPMRHVNTIMEKSGKLPASRQTPARGPIERAGSGNETHDATTHLRMAAPRCDRGYRHLHRRRNPTRFAASGAADPAESGAFSRALGLAGRVCARERGLARRGDAGADGGDGAPRCVSRASADGGHAGT